MVVLEGMLVFVPSFDFSIRSLKVSGENAWKI